MTAAGLDPGRLRLLREVAVRGSIAAAARGLGLTPSAVSQQLAVLEREAGMALLDRSSRGVQLTGAGAALSARAGAIADQLAGAQADLERLRGEISGEVRLATVASAAATIVSAAALALRRDHPGIELHVQTGEPAHSLQLLLDGDIAAALVDEYDSQPVARPEHLVQTSLRTEPLVVVLRHGGMGKSGTTKSGATEPGATEPGGIHLGALAAADWVMPPEDAACGQAIRSACRALGFQPRVRWETDDMLLLARAVAAGHGIAVLPRLAVDATVPGIEVRELLSPRLNRRLTLLVRPAGARRPVVEALTDALRHAALGNAALGNAALGNAALGNAALRTAARQTAAGDLSA